MVLKLVTSVELTFLGRAPSDEGRCLALTVEKISVSQSISRDILESGLDLLDQRGDGQRFDSYVLLKI